MFEGVLAQMKMQSGIDWLDLQTIPDESCMRSDYEDNFWAEYAWELYECKDWERSCWYPDRP